MTAGEWRAVGRAAGHGGLPTEGALCLFYSRLKEPPSVINQVSTRGFFPCVFFLLF